MANPKSFYNEPQHSTNSKNLITIQGHKFLIDQDVVQWNGVATEGINEALSIFHTNSLKVMF